MQIDFNMCVCSQIIQIHSFKYMIFLILILIVKVIHFYQFYLNKITQDHF